MIRTLFFVACLVALTLARDPVDQAEYFSRNGRLATGPFCDSSCIPGGDWIFRRDWVDLESEYEDIFMWQADSTASNYWVGSNSCGEDVNDLMFNQVNNARTIQSYKDCRPEIIYMIKFELDYNHGAGYMLERLRVSGSYTPTQRSWENFIDDFFEMTVERVTHPWDLLRLIPSVGEEPVTDDYDDEFALTQRYLANYERNFCSYQTSILPVQTQLRCRFQFDDDDTEDPNFSGLITTGFCDYITETYEYEFQPGTCGDLGNDSCDVMDVDVVNLAKKMPGARLRALAASVRSNSHVEITEFTEEDRATEKAKRDQYEFDQQPIPDYGSCSLVDIRCSGWYDAIWRGIGTTYKYSYVPYASSITSPYCAYRS
jgi:hypothetical protein